MKQRKLGHTDISVSELCLGTMTWGEQNTEAEAWAQLDLATAEGVNFIDAAEMYPVPPRPETQGLTEQYLGNWLAARGGRERLVIATKVVGPGDSLGHIRNGPRLTAAQVRHACDASLRRLQTDYIDLYQVHWPDRNTNFFGRLGYDHDPAEDATPIEETLGALAELVQAGKVRHIGLSNETPWGVMEYLRLAESHNWPRPVAIQNPYNLLNRSFEVGLAEVACREQVGLLAYSPLAFGALSGKYLHGMKPEGARLTLFSRFSRYTGEHSDAAIQAYVELARAHGLSPVHMALAYVTSRGFLTSNIIGATSVAQLRENLDSTRVVLTDEVLTEIEQLHQIYTYPCP
ncbi:NADP(H)-dependent aldo-keto reductase [Marinobacter sp. X15-166B]|uniref:NADP(H)-dependent aldo-keto reductase n=1 Tax=Marinobacter sp. X15-166B TaxID=1897620 RepID=UPI00085C709A|nr:NADP(H)-dependent aldo-keto reductase [Marinobacter sp. X15-166B]OEY66872.1 aldo/keto reductase [Marinobacter sp. X15-166B]